MSERFTTPVGRFIQGDCFKPQDKDMQGNPRVVKSGPNAGQPNPQFFIGLAIPKTPGVVDWKQEPHPFFQTVVRTGQQDFPGGQHAWPQFAWKIIDGDSPALNQRGRAWNTIEGYAGHWVCRFGSSYPPKCFARCDGYEAHNQITDANRIRRGHYLTINGSTSGNGDTTGKPGMYLNLDLISWEGYGPEITSGPDANEAFGAAAPALPAGASAAPQVAGGAAFPPFAASPAVAPGASPTPPVPAGASAAPTSPSNPAPQPVPYAGFMATPAPAVPAPAAPPPAPPVNTAYPGRMMLPPAGGASYEAMIAAGWTDATLVQHGMMAA